MTSDAQAAPAWEFWIDRGGTFTDVIGRAPDGVLHTAKLLSDRPDDYDDAVGEGIRRLLPKGASISTVRLGTTVTTNALLTRNGARTALLVSRGFRDVLRISNQQRPRLFDLIIEKPEPLHEQVIEADERVLADGTVEQALDEHSLREALLRARADGIQALAICFMHGYKFPHHEQAAARVASKCGFEHVSVGSELSPLIRYVERCSTTLLDASLAPVLSSYLAKLKRSLAALGDPDILVMQSNGGLIQADRLRAKDSVLSGPAGGIVGMTKAAKAAGLKKLIGFDMGGTSTDVSAFNERVELASGGTIAGVSIGAPQVAVHTIAAGGGSKLRIDNRRYQTGPQSAGAQPGPVCYRNGGPLTLTDANVLLGRIPVDHFPKVFGPDSDQALDKNAVEKAFRSLKNAQSEDALASGTTAEMAAGFVEIAIENMANAIRQITLARGQDPADYALAVFGGAGGQHACQVASRLGISTIWSHPLGGILSAYGMGLAERSSLYTKSVELPLENAGQALTATGRELHEAATGALREQGVAGEHIEVELIAGLRLGKSDSVLEIAAGELQSMQQEFLRRYLEQFGHHATNENIELVYLRAIARELSTRQSEQEIAPGASAAVAEGRQTVFLDGRWQEVDLFYRRTLAPGHMIIGPAVICEEHGTFLLEADWNAKINQLGHLLATTDAAERKEKPQPGSNKAVDPVLLEVFNGRFMNIAERMGQVLERTAQSVNIRERLDYSCAIFDQAGRLLANAPHMPVHLGSMGESVKSLMAANKETMKKGDAWIMNSPYAGGTHLPDVTLVSPVFTGGSAPEFYVAARAHHADIGGSSPGSMPSDSHSIHEEGVLIENFLIARDGKLRIAELDALLRSSELPCRNPPQNIADLAAQLAACHEGELALGEAIDHYGLATVSDYAGYIFQNAADSVCELLKELTDGYYEVFLDSGERIRARISLGEESRRLSIDFSGTSAQSTNNFNAPRAVARAAVLYVLRCLVAKNIPLNDGCLQPVDILIEKGSLLDPEFPSAVVAGNVETSQQVTDCLLAAFGALANSQGTMNNFTFGNDEHQYYETIAGGAGAGPGGPGASAIQTHMTNSRLTDPEILEARYPVMLEEFSIRHGSGGKGKYSGGNGVCRRLRFLAPMEASLLTSRRSAGAAGLAGGGSGAPGSNFVIRAEGSRLALAAVDSVAVAAGDCIEIETPGGGGYGE